MTRAYRAGLAAVIGCGVMAAAAQEAGPSDARVLEEVTVTAQKRTESVQDVPISIAVVTADDLANLNLQDFTETVQLTPGVDVFPGLQSAAIRLRGVGPAFFALNTPQSVTVFVDQVAQSQIGAVFSTLVDVERLELLRGPQGTLYGQNAPGGAYNISTRRPNTEALEGYVEGSYSQFDSSDLATTDLRGAINLPLIEHTLGWRPHYTLAGGLGNDTYLVDDPGDVVIESPDEGTDTLLVSYSVVSETVVDLSAGPLQYVEKATALGLGALGFIGNALDNVLIGNASSNALTGGDGNDLLDGGAGADVLTGGAGDDVYVVEHAGDVVAEIADDGVEVSDAIGNQQIRLTLP